MPLKLDIGCGGRGSRQEGFIGVDIHPRPAGKTGGGLKNCVIPNIERILYGGNHTLGASPIGLFIIKSELIRLFNKFLISLIFIHFSSIIQIYFE